MDTEAITTDAINTDTINNSRRQLLLGRFGRLQKAPLKTPPQAPNSSTKHIAHISSACLSQQAIACFSCKEICPQEAISLANQLGHMASPTVNPNLCTACGDCTANCPTHAITLKPFAKEISHEPSGST